MVRTRISEFTFPTNIYDISKFRVEPKIYEVLLLRSDDDCRPPLYKYKNSSKQRIAIWERVKAYAKHVLVQGVSASVAYEVLQSCVNVKNLMLWSAEHRNLKQLIFSLPVERLSVNVLELTGFDKDTTDTTGAGDLEENFVFDHTYFVNLTHLDVVYVPKSVRSWDRWKNLALLPRLTHLSFYASTVDMVKNTLKECEKLKLLVLIFQEDVTEHGDEVGNGKFPSGIFDDCRVVQMADRPSDEWVEDWISGAHGKGDFWLEAEQMQQVQKIQKFLRNSSQNSVVEYAPMYETVVSAGEDGLFRRQPL